MKSQASFFNKNLALFISLTLLILSSSAKAKYEYWESEPPSHPNAYSPVKIDIVGDHGRVLNKYPTHSKKHAVRRAYLEAIKGKQYKLRIRNTSGRRVGVVIAIDGRNILTGKKSWLGKNERMYILGPYETSSYKGWRTNKNHVNRFYFTSAGNSYADAWGDRSAMGVIAVAVYNEKRERHYYDKRKHASPNAMGKSRRGYLAEESAGTGFGDEEYSPTVKVKFKAKNRPLVKHFFKYEWRESLCKRGVIKCARHGNNRPDNRFWPNEENNGYAPYPPGYDSWGH